MNNGFFQKEDACLSRFNSLGTVYHCYSQEDFEIIFTSPVEFQKAILVFAICCKLCPSVRVITYQFMSNHFHFVLVGTLDEINRLIDLFKRHLQMLIDDFGRYVNVKGLIFKTLVVGDLEYARTTIAYCNRNGFVVNDDVTPFSYPWGANICYFNPMAKRYYNACKEHIGVVELRKVFHGKSSDMVRNLYRANGEDVSPFSFCEINVGESLFRDAKQYFYYVSKNVESYGKVAATIGESIAYTDDDLYAISKKIAEEKYGNTPMTLLPSASKIEMAKTLHYDYNAGNKQIQRFLKLEPAIVDALF